MRPSCAFLMIMLTHKILLSLGAFAAVPAFFVAQQNTPDASPRASEVAAVVTAKARRTAPQISREQQELFLRTAKIEKMWQLAEGATELAAGSTRSWRATL